MNEFKVGDFVIASERSGYFITGSDIICKVLDYKVDQTDMENLLVVAWCMRDENPYLFKTQSTRLLKWLSEEKSHIPVESYWVDSRHFSLVGAPPQVFVVTMTGTVVNIVNSNTGAKFCSTGEDFKSTIRKTIFGLIEVSTEGAKL